MDESMAASGCPLEGQVGALGSEKGWLLIEALPCGQDGSQKWENR